MCEWRWIPPVAGSGAGERYARIQTSQRGSLVVQEAQAALRIRADRLRTFCFISSQKNEPGFASVPSMRSFRKRRTLVAETGGGTRFSVRDAEDQVGETRLQGGEDVRLPHHEDGKMRAS